MAQINTRVKDESKEKAELVLAAAGHTFSSYFSALTDYIAETNSLPFQIRYKPAVVSPVEVFTEVLQRYKTVWGRLNHFSESLVPEQQPLDKIAMKIQSDIDEAYRFYRANEDLILLAPGQLTDSAVGENKGFPASLDAINQLNSSLRLAVGNLASLAVMTPEHIEFTRKQVEESAKHINELQRFTGNSISGLALNQMIIRDANEAIHCAKKALEYNENGEGIPFYTFTMWHERFTQLLFSVRSMQNRAGATEATHALAELCDQLAALEAYLLKNEHLRIGKISGYIPDQEIIELAQEKLEIFRNRSGGQMEFVTNELDI
ncbi:type II toxin-antitoxin system RelB/DinJ family antitoxin [Aeromonas veronii]|uniref:type II toxin-antitoxin system RelB/DinJ family antitoxin n=1 Tax=Aeromonas veronii TaxID=654 RepID=UPI0022465377|nr:type II toxin-antitoxin system RelB/DinJ family antitoxin [Aeromonas veronii]EKP0300223.1 type II toxin-antitoxin system RelB/DinJ family antitoxin [Aeromonas veronii]MCX0429672.1 type II toxin-antitoxin system RelB/DinJ family antitoxin [Aeromonas veronii]